MAMFEEDSSYAGCCRRRCLLARDSGGVLATGLRALRRTADPVPDAACAPCKSCRVVSLRVFVAVG